MAKTVKCSEISDAARDVLDWPSFVEDWAEEAITRAMGNVVEHLRAGGNRDDLCPLPPYAVSRVRSAIAHVNGVVRFQERQLERYNRDRKPTPIF